MHRIAKILGVILAGGILLLGSSQLMLAYPGFLLSYQLRQGNFAIASDKAFAPEIREKLDSLTFRLKQTGFYHERKLLKVVLSHDSALSRFFDLLCLGPDGATGFQHFSGRLYIFPERILTKQQRVKGASEALRKCLQYTHQEYRWEYILAHEVLHQLHSDTLGFWTFKQKLPPPSWKAEGFAEYYTWRWDKQQDSTYGFGEKVALYRRFRDQHPIPYLQYQLLYEYFTEHEQRSFSEIMELPLSAEEAFAKLETHISLTP